MVWSYGYEKVTALVEGSCDFRKSRYFYYFVKGTNVSKQITLAFVGDCVFRKIIWDNLAKTD